MNDQQLRALVRDAVARHLGRVADPAAAQPLSPTSMTAPSLAVQHEHPSHAMYLTLVNTGDACLIEPAVMCNHCGYCKTHGH